MKRFSPAKINLTLRVLGTRPDGFHALDSLVVPLSLGDEVTLERAEETSLSVTSEEIDLSPMPADPEKNLALRALRLLERHANRALPTRISIAKRIPLGGGLGGGSSNAATVLRGINDLWNLALSTETLCALGAELGSDVPLFILDGAVRMQGRGEIVERLPRGSVAPMWVVLANDGTHCPTPQVYRALDEQRAATVDAPFSLTNGGGIWDTLRLSLQRGEPEEVAKGLVNDLEAPCFRLFSGVARTAEALRAAGCKGVRLCGSGATVFGLVHTREEGEHALEQEGLSDCWRACVQTLPDGVMAAHGPLTPIVMVRIHVGQPKLPSV